MLFLAVSAGLCASLCYLDTTKNLKKKKNSVDISVERTDMHVENEALTEWENMNKKRHRIITAY